MSNDNPQLAQYVTRVGYTKETVCGEDPFDPTSASYDPTSRRVRHIGRVKGIPTLKEDFDHQESQPQGSGRDPNNIYQKGARFTLEINSEIDANMDDEFGFGNEDLFGMWGGRLLFQFDYINETVSTPFKPGESVSFGGLSATVVRDDTTAKILYYQRPVGGIFADTDPIIGAVTGKAVDVDGEIQAFVDLEHTPIDTGTWEYGWRDHVNHVDNIGVTGGEGVYDVTIGATLYSHSTTGVESATVIRDFLIGLINGGAEPVDAFIEDPSSLQIIGQNTGDRLSVSVTYSPVGGGGGAITLTSVVALQNWYHRLRGGKITSIGISLVARDISTMTVRIAGLFHDDLRNEVAGPAGGRISDLTEHLNPGHHFKDTTFTFVGPNGVILSNITQCDLTFENNLVPQPIDNQMFEDGHIIEDKRRITVTLKTLKLNNEFLDVFRGRPGLASGQVSIQIVMDQRNPPVDGFYMDLLIPASDLTNRDNPTGEDIPKNEETFDGMCIGIPTIQMRRQPIVV